MTATHFTSWREAIAVYRHRRVITMLFLGFSAGLPFLLVFSTLAAWLSDAQISRSAIGLFAWVGITYSIKVFWSPIVDRIRLPILTTLFGQRRSWMILAQMGIACGLVGLSFTDPGQQLYLVALFALLVAFSSATQDITIDAFRIEATSADRQGAMAASYQFGYRVALLVAGAGALYLADFFSWSTSYLVMALLTLVGFITALIISEPTHTEHVKHFNYEDQVNGYLSRTIKLPENFQRAIAWFIGAVINPFVEFFDRNGASALLILLFISIFRISDITMGIMANPFYLDLGFSKTEIANIVKFFGFFMTLAGAAIGGLLVVRYGIMRPLLLGAVMVSVTNLLFAFMATQGTDLTLLAVVISADNLSGGLSTTAFIAYLSSMTNQAYTATQYALFSSLMTLPGKFISGFSGFIVDGYGYVNFFIYASMVGIPAIILVIYLMRRMELENK